MNIKEALNIVKEFQKYRRGEKPYDGETPETYKRFDYSGKPLGEALDCIIKFVDVTGGNVVLLSSYPDLSDVLEGKQIAKPPI